MARGFLAEKANPVKPGDAKLWDLNPAHKLKSAGHDSPAAEDRSFYFAPEP